MNLSDVVKTIASSTKIKKGTHVALQLDTTEVQLPDGAVAIARSPAVRIRAILGDDAAGHSRAKRSERVAGRPWVKTSLAPGRRSYPIIWNIRDCSHPWNPSVSISQRTDAPHASANSGPLHPANRGSPAHTRPDAGLGTFGTGTFEGRIHKNVKASFLMSPPLVVAYALAGRIDIDLTKEALGNDKDGNPVYLKDLWPDPDETVALVKAHVTRRSFVDKYRDVFAGDERWASLFAPEGDTYRWDPQSTYIAKAPSSTNFPRNRR